MIRVDPRDPLEINFFARRIRGNRGSHAEWKCSYMKEYAEAHATLAPPSGWQAQTKCVRFREFCAFCVRFFYQTVISFFLTTDLAHKVSPCGMLGKMRV
jgi:hypothetical protein